MKLTKYRTYQSPRVQKTRLEAEGIMMSCSNLDTVEADELHHVNTDPNGNDEPMYFDQF